MSQTWVPMYELAECIGKEEASNLSAAIGGVSFYVPKKASADHKLAKIIGVQAMERLCKAYSNLIIVIPNGRKPRPHKEEIIRLLDEKLSYAQIALQLGVTERYVCFVASQRKPCFRQLKFDL